MFSFLWFLIIGGLIGSFAGALLGQGVPGGIFGNIVAGVIGAWIGGNLLGEWGWKISNFYIFPSLVGALIFIFIVSLLLQTVNKSE